MLYHPQAALFTPRLATRSRALARSRRGMSTRHLTILVTLIFLGGSVVVGIFAENKTNNSPSGAEPAPAAPVPLLSPEEEIKTFKLPPGFHAEVVAQDPMIQHPVALAFDPDGRIWVVEMRA